MILKKIFSLNEQGHREKQEDNIYPNPGAAAITNRLFIVCDGVGGNSHGEVASQMTCKAIAEYISSMPERRVNDRQIVSAIHQAKDLMQQFVLDCPKAKFMSTTLATVYLMDNSIWALWCGDSRIYHIRDGKVLWQSKDHSLVQQLIDDGESAATNSFTHIDRHLIENIEPDDYILLCTDGILENIDNFSMHLIQIGDLAANSINRDLTIADILPFL